MCSDRLFSCKVTFYETLFPIHNTLSGVPNSVPMKINFKLFTAKIDQGGLCPIFIRSKLNGRGFVYYTGEKCKPEDWEDERVRRTDKNYKNINECLDKVSRDIETFIHDCKLRGVIPTVENIKIAICPVKESSVIKEKGVVDLYDEFLEWSRAEGKKAGTLRMIKVTRNHLAEFERSNVVEIGNFTDEVYKKFISFMMSKFNYQPNSIGNQTKNLKAFFFWCRDKKFLKLSERHAKLSVIKLDVEKIYLTWEEIVKMRDVELVEHLSNIRDSFLFGCYTGLRYSDLKTLVADNIKEVNGTHIISITPQKTNSFYKKTQKKVSIALIPEAVRIIEKYSESHVNALPVISNQKMNQYLKDIGKRAGIDEMVEIYKYVDNRPVSEFVEKYKLITCHVARHTFATQSISRGVPAEVIQKILGHSDIKTTMIYAKIVEEYKHKSLLKAWED